MIYVFKRVADGKYYRKKTHGSCWEDDIEKAHIYKRKGDAKLSAKWSAYGTALRNFEFRPAYYCKRTGRPVPSSWQLNGEIYSYCQRENKAKEMAEEIMRKEYKLIEVTITYLGEVEW